MVSRFKSQAAVVEAVAKKLDPPPLGQKINDLHDLREAKRKLEAEVKEIEDKYNVIAAEVMDTLEAQGTSKSTGTKASVSITMTDVGNVTDWSQAEAYFIKTKQLHFFQRRLNDAAVREVWQAGKKIPGIEPFTKKRLNLRAVGE